MNVERLHRVLKDLREDIKDSDIIEFDEEFIEEIRQMQT